MIKDTLCVKPWIHLVSEPSGKVTPCCLITSDIYTLGNLKTDSIDTIWNSTKMKQLRVEMIEGKEPAICKRRCFDEEKIGMKSSRINRNQQFPNSLKNISNITLPDGTCTKMELKYWDFRFSNLCNFKCRSCGPDFSSTWIPDAAKLGWKINQEKISTTEINFDFLKGQLEQVESINFAGGEPMLMDEHWAILEMLVEHKKFDVMLSYNTNCSTLTHGKKDIFDYWSHWKFGKIRVEISIDEIGTRAELIRFGTVWSKVEDNLRKLSKCENIHCEIGITVSVFNVFRLPEIITYLTDNEFIKDGNFYLNTLISPEYYQVQILPDNFKQEIIKKLTEFIEIYNKKYSNITDNFNYLFTRLTIPSDQTQIEKFKEITEKLDEIRSENTYETIPELKIFQ